MLAHLLAIALGAQPLASSGCDDLTGLPLIPAVDWQTEIKPLINELLSPAGRCTSCHNPGDAGGGLDLTDAGFDAIYKLVNSYVIPGDPGASLLFAKLNCEAPPVGARMPLDGIPFTIDEQALFHDWIAQGALGEPAEEPIFRDFLFRDGGESRRH